VQQDEIEDAGTRGPLQFEQFVILIYTTHICVSVCVYMCVCVYVCVRERERAREKKRDSV